MESLYAYLSIISLWTAFGVYVYYKASIQNRAISNHEIALNSNNLFSWSNLMYAISFIGVVFVLSYISFLGNAFILLFSFITGV